MDRNEYNTKWKKENKDKMVISGKRYRKKNALKISLKEKEYRIKNPKKEKAHNLAKYHIQIPKRALCCVCEKEKAIDRHHEDYDKELEVWLCCKPCHKEVLDRQRQAREEDD